MPKALAQSDVTPLGRLFGQDYDVGEPAGAECAIEHDPLFEVGQSIQISNGGGATLTWTASTSAPWLTVPD
jgi:hypothetical protein